MKSDAGDRREDYHPHRRWRSDSALRSLPDARFGRPRAAADELTEPSPREPPSAQRLDAALTTCVLEALVRAVASRNPARQGRQSSEKQAKHYREANPSTSRIACVRVQLVLTASFVLYCSITAD